MRTWRRLSLIPTFSLCGNSDLRLALQPSIDVLAHHIFGETVALLEYTFKLFTLSVDLSQIVLSELTPPFFDLTLSLLPISFDEVPVHFTAPTKRTPNSNVGTWLPFRMRGCRSACQVSGRRVPGRPGWREATRGGGHQKREHEPHHLLNPMFLRASMTVVSPCPKQYVLSLFSSLLIASGSMIVLSCLPW